MVTCIPNREEGATERLLLREDPRLLKFELGLGMIPWDTS